MTLCLYLPDGGVGFMFGRPRIADNARVRRRRHALRGARADARARDPLRGDSVPARAPPRAPRSAGGLHAEPARAGSGGAGPTTRFRPPTAASCASSATGSWVSVRAERAGQEFARGHLEQHGRATGSVAVGDRTLDDRRLRAARPVLGAALLAGAAVLSLAHHELRSRRRHRRRAHRAARRLAGPGWLSLRGRAGEPPHRARRGRERSRRDRSSCTGGCGRGSTRPTAERPRR